MAGAGGKPIPYNKKPIQHYLKKIYKKCIDSGGNIWYNTQRSKIASGGDMHSGEYYCDR